MLITDLTTGCAATDTIIFEELITCPSDLVAVPTAFSPTNDGENDYLQMYPNPTTNSIQFGSVDQLSFDYKILDMDGRLITDGKAHSNQKIDVSSS